MSRYTVGPDVDLDNEDVRLSSGERLTNELAEELAEEAVTVVRRGGGRRALHGTKRGETSPPLNVRLGAAVRTELDQAAQEEHTTPSKLARSFIADGLAARHKAS